MTDADLHVSQTDAAMNELLIVAGEASGDLHGAAPRAVRVAHRWELSAPPPRSPACAVRLSSWAESDDRFGSEMHFKYCMHPLFPGNCR